MDADGGLDDAVRAAGMTKVFVIEIPEALCGALESDAEIIRQSCGINLEALGPHSTGGSDE